MAPKATITDLHRSATDPALNAMTFLNEISARHPHAVSFAAGRPGAQDVKVSDLANYIELFCHHLRTDLGLSEEVAEQTVLQYGRTKGIIHSLVARYLREDEGIIVDPETLVITVGCQEAMFLVLRALAATPQDVLMVTSPAYVGITGAAALVDMPTWPVRSGTTGIDLNDLHLQVHRARAAGARPRALYIVADHANPTGLTLDLATRHRLLHAAEQLDLLLIEDNPYNIFSDTNPPLPTLKALDTKGRVIYLGTFAKTALAGARIGFIAADQVHVRGNNELALPDALAAIKSALTLNTPPIAQAVIAGILLKNGFSLRHANINQVAEYQEAMRCLTTGLQQRLPDLYRRGNIRWNKPTGGFFLVLTLPFPVTDELLEKSAENYGVLWTPMRHFYTGDGGEHQMRLSCSALSPQDIELGLDRLVALITDEFRAHDKTEI